MRQGVPPASFIGCRRDDQLLPLGLDFPFDWIARETGQAPAIQLRVRGKCGHSRESIAAVSAPLKSQTGQEVGWSWRPMTLFLYPLLHALFDAGKIIRKLSHW